jgi:hypothetical protein
MMGSWQSLAVVFAFLVFIYLVYVIEHCAIYRAALIVQQLLCQLFFYRTPMAQANNCLHDDEACVIHRAGKEQQRRPEPVVHRYH